MHNPLNAIFKATNLRPVITLPIFLLSKSLCGLGDLSGLHLHSLQN